jgi:hypothetical protein
MENISEEDMQELMAQMAQAQQKPRKINKRMIPIVMLTSPILILLTTLKTMMMRKLQAQQQKMPFEIFMKEMQKREKCNCENCNGHCHE